MRVSARLLLCLSFGCTSPTTLTLAEATGSILIPGGGASDPNPSGFTLVVSPGATGIDGCDRLSPKVTATEDSAPLALTQSAGVVGAERSADCVPAIFSSLMPPDAGAGLTTFELSDGVTTFRANYPALFAPREATLLGDGGAFPGDTIGLSWSPVSDVFVLDGGEGSEGPAVVISSATSNLWVVLNELSFDGSTVSVSLPTDLAAGPVTLLVNMTTLARASLCQGPASCSDFEMDSSIPVSLEILAR